MYKDINSAILNNKNNDLSAIHKDKLYKYLINNNIAYFYAKKISAAKGDKEKRVIREGNNYNRKFFKTLKLVDDVCRQNKIDYLLFKTFKYVPEGYSGDLDIIIKEEAFERIIEIFEKRGFSTRFDVGLKVELRNAGYSKIEFRVNVEYHGITLFDSKEIWEYKEKTKLGGIEIFKTTKEFDLVCLLLNILYGPNYLDLYLMLLNKQVGSKKLLSFKRGTKLAEDLRFIISNLVKKDFSNKRFPLFIPDLIYLRWWLKNIFLSDKVFLFEKFKVILIFFYIKYKYLFFDNLQYAHRWLETDLL